MRNTSYILAIELLAACQALDLGGRPVEEDRCMTDEIELAAELIRKGALLPVVEEAGITLQ